jgi:hypothetical protein
VLGEDLGGDGGGDRAVGEAVCQAYYEELWKDQHSLITRSLHRRAETKQVQILGMGDGTYASDFHHRSGLVPVIRVGSSEGGEHEEGERLDGEARDEQLLAPEAVDGESVDEHDEELQDGLDAVDGEGLAALVPAERLVD